MTTALLATARLLRLVLHLLAGFATIRLRFAGLSQHERELHVQRWALGMLERLRVTLLRQGPAVPRGPLLLVVNHISWLDVLVLHAAGYCRFVSKAEVRHWPLVGTMATGAGTLYIERASRRDAMRVVHHVAESLARGEVVAAFPEGTTSDGSALLPFHGNLIQAAIAVDAPVQPAGLRYVDAASGAPSRVPCYIGGETLIASLWRTLTAPRLTAVLNFGAAQRAGTRDRRRFAADLQAEVDRLRQATLPPATPAALPAAQLQQSPDATEDVA